MHLLAYRQANRVLGVPPRHQSSRIGTPLLIMHRNTAMRLVRTCSLRQCMEVAAPDMAPFVPTTTTKKDSRSCRCGKERKASVAPKAKEEEEERGRRATAEKER